MAGTVVIAILAIISIISFVGILLGIPAIRAALAIPFEDRHYSMARHRGGLRYSPPDGLARRARPPTLIAFSAEC
jgi:hypothetical protein